MDSVLKLIQSYSSVSKNSSNKVFKTNFGCDTTITIDDNTFSTAYTTIINQNSEEIKRYKEDKKKDNFDATKYGLPYMEKPLDNMFPILIDFNFKFNSVEQTNHFSAFLIAKLVNILQEVVRDIVIIDDDEPKELTVFALKNESWYDSKTKEERQKLRLICPGTYVNRTILNDLIIPLFIEDLDKENLFLLFNNSPKLSDWSKIISLQGEFVSMYGSKEKENESLMILYKIYPHFLESIAEDSIANDLKMYNVTKNINNLLETFLVEDAKYFFDNTLDIDDYYEEDRNITLPLILSVNFPNKRSRINQDAIGIKTLIEEDKNRVVQEKRSVSSSRSDQTKIFKELIKFISKERFKVSTKYYWYDIGRCIFNIFKGSPDGKKEFKDITPPELEKDLERFWCSMGREKLDIRTIKEFANQDSPKDYKKWIRMVTAPIMQRCFESNGKDMPMSLLVAELFSTEYVYCRFEDMWYKKNNSVLRPDPKGYELKEDIYHTLRDYFMEEYEIRSESLRNNTEPEVKKVLEAKCKTVLKIITQLDSGLYIERIIKSLKGKLFDDNLKKFRDENLYTMACTNLVIEIYDKTITTRPGKLQDYITKCTDIAFPTNYSAEHPKVKELTKYLHEIHTDEEMFHFFAKDLASYLLGGNPEKYFRNFIGERNASKSKLVELLQLAFGEYCVDFPSDSITSNKYGNSGGADPALDQARGSRLAIVSETSKSEPLDAKKIKKFTGNDRYWTRTLHKEGGSRSLTFKLIHMSNVIAEIPNADKGYLCREVVYPFLSQWLAKAPSSYAKQFAQRKFKMDTKFSEKIKSFAQAMLFFQFSYFPIYMKEGIKKLPKIVKDETRAHHREIDPFYNFIKEKIEISYIFPNDDVKKKFKNVEEMDNYVDEVDDESDGETDDDFDMEDYESEDEEDEVKTKKDELRTYLDPNKRISISEAFNAYSKWYEKYMPCSKMNISQSDFCKEMIQEDRLGPLFKSSKQWLGASIKKHIRR